jgi:putative ABC transport system permease protein
MELLSRKMRISLRGRDMRQDFRSAFRLILNEPGFAAAVVFTLALGIGANTAIFSVVNSVLLRPLGYPDPGRLVTITEVIPKVAHLYPELPVNLNHFFEWRKEARSFESLALYQRSSMTLTGSGEPELLEGVAMTPNTFKTLGLQPALGRDFADGELGKGHDGVVILSNALWKRRFSADPGVIGRKIVLDGRPLDVIGVMADAFRFPERRSGQFGATAIERETFYKPLGYDPKELENKMGNFNYSVYGRLRPATSVEAAGSELNVIQGRIIETLPEKIELRSKVTVLQEAMVGDSRKALWVLMAAVASVLLVLCVNLANLWFARSAARRQEMAVRVALGASRWRLMRQDLVESMTLAAAGGAIGCALAYSGVQLLLSLAPVTLPRLEEVRLDSAALSFAIGLSLVAGALFGAVPAWRMSRSDPQRALRSATRSNTEDVQGVRTRKVLVAAEVALSTVLLACAGLLIRSFDRLMHVDRGFSIDRVLAVDVPLAGEKYKEDAAREQFYRRLIEKARAMPGVENTSILSHLPFKGEMWVDIVGPENDTRPMFQRDTVNVRFISPDYFATIGLPLRSGRTFLESDRERKVVILTQSIANKLFPGEDPVGRKITHNETKKEVIGVIPDTRSTALDKDPVRTIYIPYWQANRFQASLLLKTANDPSSLANAVRKMIWELDPEVPIPAARTFEQLMNDSVAQRRFQTTLIVAFAVAALALASLGVYGVLAYTVTRRRNEIGVRMALGAGPGRVRRLVVMQGMLPVLAGLAIGLAASLAAGRVLTSMLFQVKAADPVTLIAVPVVLGVVAILACFAPAIRATRIDPVEALRCE